MLVIYLFIRSSVRPSVYVSIIHPMMEISVDKLNYISGKTSTKTFQRNIIFNVSSRAKKEKQQQTMTLICEEQSSAWLDGRQKRSLTSWLVAVHQPLFYMKKRNSKKTKINFLKMKK